MKIDGNTLKAIVPDLKERGIPNAYHAASVIGKYYCDPLTMVGMCPEICTHCTRHLDHMTANMQDAKYWHSLLIWRAKNERAIVKDLNSTHEAPQVSGAENIFDAYLALLK